MGWLLLVLAACGTAETVEAPDRCAGVDCDDWLSCTQDLCTTSGECRSELLSGHCLIDGVCYDEGEADSAQSCRLCEPAVSVSAWGPVDPCCEAFGGPCPTHLGFECLSGVAAHQCWKPDSMEIFVPTGTFWMGCNSAKDTACFIEETPQHEVALPAYAIDRTEVRAGDYKRCVDAGVCNAPGLPEGQGTYDAKPDHPINGVTYAQASSYCAWPDKPQGEQRLCTEAEWEKAARGGCAVYGCGVGDAACCASAMPVYPWGDSQPSCALATLGPDCGSGQTSKVGSRPEGASPYGVLDLAGSLLERVGDWYAGDYYCHGDAAACDGACDGCKGQPPFADSWKDPKGPAGSGSLQKVRVLRGGVPPPAKPRLRSSYRDGLSPDWFDIYTGFRCCRRVGI